MTRPIAQAQSGFTLVEAIIAIVITGIVAGIISVFMVLPIQGYIDAVRRADLTDVADTALRRIGFELRGAVPNTVRVDASGSFLEFIPAADGGRYRSQQTSGGSGDPLDGTGTDTGFEVLGPTASGAAGDFLVIYNTGQTGLDAYAGNNRRTLSAAAGATISYTATGSPFPPFESPSQRFQVVPASGPVSFACTGVGPLVSGNGTGTLRRYSAYGFNATQPTTGLGTGFLLADNLSACNFEYAMISASNGLLILKLTVTRDSESVTLHHEIHVDNTP